MANGNSLVSVNHVVVLMRTDDVLAGVTVPVSSTPSPAIGITSHLEQIREELISRQYPAGSPA